LYDGLGNNTILYEVFTTNIDKRNSHEMIRIQVVETARYENTSGF